MGRNRGRQWGDSVAAYGENSMAAVSRSRGNQEVSQSSFGKSPGKSASLLDSRGSGAGAGRDWGPAQRLGCSSEVAPVMQKTTNFQGFLMGTAGLEPATSRV